MSARGAGGTVLRLCREAAVRSELARALGPRQAWRRARLDRRLGRVGRAHRTRVYRRIWADAATSAGAELVELTPELLELRRGVARTRVRHQTLALDDSLSIELSLDKPLVHRLLADASLPVPAHVEFRAGEPAAAEAFLAREGGPCVLKPAASGGAGWGVSTGVRAAADLRRAIARASHYGGRLLIERQVEGSVYRVLVLDGEILDLVRRDPPRVVGDGQSTIATLVAEESRRRLAAAGDAGLSPLHVDLDALITLERAGLTPRSVPGRGEAVVVKVVTQQNRNEENETVREPVSPALREEVARTAEVVGLRVAGVDLIARGLDRPLAESGGVVLEVNGEPGLHHHYHVADPQRATPVAVPLLERALGDASRGGSWARQDTTPRTHPDVY
jgi:cyanophycin synthetase